MKNQSTEVLEKHKHSLLKLKFEEISPLFNYQDSKALETIKRIPLDLNKFHTFFYHMFQLLYKEGEGPKESIRQFRQILNITDPNPEKILTLLSEKYPQLLIDFVRILASFIDRVDTKKEILSKLFGICKLIPPEFIVSPIISLFFYQADANLFPFFLDIVHDFFQRNKRPDDKLICFFLTTLEEDYSEKNDILQNVLFSLMNKFPTQTFFRLIHPPFEKEPLFNFLEIVLPYKKCPKELSEEQMEEFLHHFISERFDFHSNFFKKFFQYFLNTELPSIISFDCFSLLFSKIYSKFPDLKSKTLMQVSESIQVSEKLHQNLIICPFVFQFLFGDLNTSDLAIVLTHSFTSPFFIQILKIFVQKQQKQQSLFLDHQFKLSFSFIFQLPIQIDFNSMDQFRYSQYVFNQSNFQKISFQSSAFKKNSLLQLHPFKFTNDEYTFNSFRAFQSSSFLWSFQLKNLLSVTPLHVFSQLYIPQSFSNPPESLVEAQVQLFTGQNQSNSPSKVTFSPQFQSQYIPNPPNPFHFHNYHDFKQAYVNWMILSSKILFQGIPHPISLGFFHDALIPLKRSQKSTKNEAKYLFQPCLISKPQKQKVYATSNLLTFLMKIQEPQKGNHQPLHLTRKYLLFGVDQDVFQNCLKRGEMYCRRHQNDFSVISHPFKYFHLNFPTEPYSSTKLLKYFLKPGLNPTDLLFLFPKHFSIDAFNIAVKGNPQILNLISNIFQDSDDLSNLYEFLYQSLSMKSNSISFFTSLFLDLIFIPKSSSNIIQNFNLISNFNCFYLFVQCVLIRSTENVVLLKINLEDYTDYNQDVLIKIWQLHLFSVLEYSYFCRNKLSIKRQIKIEIQKLSYSLLELVQSVQSPTFLHIIYDHLFSKDESVAKSALLIVEMIISFHDSFEIKAILYKIKFWTFLDRLKFLKPVLPWSMIEFDPKFLYPFLQESNYFQSTFIASCGFDFANDFMRKAFSVYFDYFFQSSFKSHSLRTPPNFSKSMF
jgi:hypothetical protein